MNTAPRYPSMVLGDTTVTTIAIDGKDLRDGDVIICTAGQFPPVVVTRVICRDEYAVTFRAAIIVHNGVTVTRETIPTCQHVANLARVHVERAR